ncbi:50S ribosomal protein L21 [Candidatus Peribacteria bacterium]|nr:50S ribosomal protein L21 [Candidatus Peribacteria bacterium]
MFAIVDIAGFQEKVEKGLKLKVPLHDAEEGKSIIIDKVLLIVDGDDVKVGLPFVSGASIELKVLSHGKGDKIRIQKFKRRKRYRRVKGHRQGFTEVEVMKITM